MTDIGQRVVRDLRDQLFKHILDQSAAFFSRWSTGPLMSRITNDVGQVQQAVSETVGDLLREGLALRRLRGVAVLLGCRPRAGLRHRRAAGGLSAGPAGAAGPPQRPGAARRRPSTCPTSPPKRSPGTASSRRSAPRQHEEQRFKRASELLYRTNLKITSTVAMLPPLMEFLGGLAVVALIWYGSREISGGHTTQGSFLGFIFAAFMMYTPIKKLSRVNTNLQQAMAASERIFKMLDTHTEVQERPGAQPLAAAAGAGRVPQRGLHLRRRAAGLRAARRLVQRRGRPDGRDRRAERRGQDDAGQPDSAVLRRDLGRGADRRRRRARRDAALAARNRSASSRRRPCSSTTPSR